MRKSWGITWRAVGVSPPSCPHLTRRAYAAPLAGFAASRETSVSGYCASAIHCYAPKLTHGCL
ncbi:MAG TPA: hypothetical protein PLY87_25415, partial [Planctomycetaceae bacterium]|nr:hypothetical protein [Planctomycetaceae bacterium]